MPTKTKRKSKKAKTTEETSPILDADQAMQGAAATPKEPSASAPKSPYWSKAPTLVTTMEELAQGYLFAIGKDGTSAGTQRSYAADLAVAKKHFGATTKIASLTQRKVANFFESEAVTQLRSGEPKNAVTVAKIRRVLRLALLWAAGQGHIAEAPIPETK